MHIISKPVQEKYDPKRPQGHPDWERAVERGKIEYPKLKFLSPAHEHDYQRAILANSNNVMGGPVFYPQEDTKATVVIALRNCRIDGHHWSNTVDKWCLTCNIDQSDL